MGQNCRFLLLGFLFLVPCLVARRHRRHSEDSHDDFNESFDQILDQRFPGEFTCHKNSSRLTTFGIDVLQHTFTPLRPRYPLGEKIFDIQMEVSADCATWDTVGYNVEKIKRSALGIQTRQTESLTHTARSHSDQFGASIGVAIKEFSASAGYETKKGISNERKTQQHYKYFISWLESIDNTLRFSHVSPPPLKSGFLDLLDVSHPGFMSDRVIWDWVFEIGTHFFERAELGSQFTEIRRVNLSSLSAQTKRMSAEDFNIAVTANFKSVSLNAGFGFGNSDDLSDTEKEIQAASEIYRTSSGDIPNMVTKSFEVTKHPGVLRHSLQPVCGLIPKNSTTLRAARRACDEFFASTKFCFCQIPRLPSLIEQETVSLLKEHFIVMQTVEQCKNIPPPVFGVKLRPTSETRVSTRSDLRDCIGFAMRFNQKLISFHDGNCIVFPSFVRTQLQMEKCGGSECVLIRLGWAADGTIFLNKASTVVGEFLKSEEPSTLFWKDENDYCDLYNILFRMHGPNRTSLRNDMISWNNILRRTLRQTKTEDCEQKCLDHSDCNFVRKTFQFGWNKMKLSPFYKNETSTDWAQQCDKDSIDRFRRLHRITLKVQCDLYTSVHFVNSDFDRAMLVNDNYGKMITSMIQKIDQWQEPGMKPYGLTQRAVWTSREERVWETY